MMSATADDLKLDCTAQFPVCQVSVQCRTAVWKLTSSPMKLMKAASGVASKAGPIMLVHHCSSWPISPCLEGMSQKMLMKATG